MREIDANELINEMSGREQIMAAVKEMRESAFSEDGVSIVLGKERV